MQVSFGHMRNMVRNFDKFVPRSVIERITSKNEEERMTAGQLCYCAMLQPMVSVYAIGLGYQPILLSMLPACAIGP
eukprot:34045-Rhodomonas_salina.1